MSDIKVSVIMPVYNAERFLEKNLLMLTKQTLKEIEFICVNDCSKDSSLNILKAFKEVFPQKFTVIDSDKNRGPGGARNIGLSYAKGQYIGFADADDYLSPDMYKAMYQEAVSGDYDIVKCGYFDKMNNKICAPFDIKGDLSEGDKRFFYAVDTVFVWNKIYRKRLLDEMSMQFRENAVGEDTDFNMEAILRAKRASSLPNPYYYYNFDGQATASRSNKINIDEYYSLAETIFEVIDLRSKTTDNYDVGLKLKEAAVKSNMLKILESIFTKHNFSFGDFERFDKFARKYSPEYFKIKNYDTENFQEMIFNNLAEDPKESYQNLIRFKEKIESGELDKEILQRKAVQSTNENN